VTAGSRRASRVRHATVDDAGTVAELGACIFVETFGPTNDEANIREYVRTAFDVERVRDEIDDPRSITLLAETDASCAGYARLHAGEPPAEVRGDAPIELVRLYVLARYHGGGIGADLMQASIDEARRAGYGTMYLGVWEHNPRAQAFYRKWGFSRVGEQSFQLGSERQTDWLMERSL
jgi:diamine N-acetyltransferase